MPEVQTLLAGAVAQEVLDAQKERAARSLGSGHHVAFGVAGWGTTLVLLARARLNAGRDPRRKVLVLCYNRALASWLAAQLNEPGLRNVEVPHFLSRAARKTGLRKCDDESFDAYESRTAAALQGGAGHFVDPGEYDAILVDEGHDFEPDWFRCAVGLLRGGPEGDLLIAVAGAQSLYGRARGFTWRSVGVGGAGPLPPALAELPEHQADPGVHPAGGPVGHRGRRGDRDPRQGPADQGVPSGAGPGSSWMYLDG